MFDTLPVDKIGVTNTRLTNLEYLGTDMIEAGNEFGPGTPYGSALIRVGQTEQALGEIEKEYIKGSHVAFCLRHFDMQIRIVFKMKSVVHI